MSIRKRKWTTGSGVHKEAWVVDYVDQQGVRRLKTFERKKEADAAAATTTVEVREGSHVADSASVSVKKAGDLWIASAAAAGLERTTVEQYQQHLDRHIEPLIGRTLLSRLNVPTVRTFEDQLRKDRSPAMVRKIIASLGALIGDAQERGLIARNPVRDMRGRRRKGKDRQSDRRQKGRLRIGVDIPAPADIKAMVAHLPERWRPILLTGIFTGLRASELRGLRWPDVDFARSELHVRQRADRFNVMGPPKSESGERTVPLPPIVVNTLREWKLRCPRGELNLVFPNGAGKIESHANIVNRGLIPAQLAAGLTVDGGKKDKDGEPIRIARYTGVHTLRHFYASWCINRPQDGGLGLPPKVVQERLGHAQITMTMDVYGHLFPRGDDTEAMATAERALLG